MPSPKEVFDNPHLFWDFLKAGSDIEFEGQHFDRKLAGILDDQGKLSSSQFSKFVESLKEGISSFANENKEGGLLVIGISRTGKVNGINHLSENQINNFTDFNTLLVHQTAVAKMVDCYDDNGNPNRICLIYVPYSDRHICETPGSSPKAFIRQGLQNIPVDDNHRERLKRDKGIVDYEISYCCPYDPNELDEGVLREFRQVYLRGAGFEYTDEEMLRNAGAIIKTSSGLAFTNAGYLFFAANPQSRLPWSYIRLLRFDADINDLASRGLPTFERMFSGPITKQIRDIRNFLRESAFFKVYQRRNPQGGFIDEPEYPPIAVDEALVNAVAHRDYAIRLPIMCESYENAFSVMNPGRLQQIDFDLPNEFSLANINLESIPRNPRLIEWLKLMRTEQGSAFVKALSEGTKSMRIAMAELNLPPPLYKTTNARTTVILFNNAEQRKKIFQPAYAQDQDYTEFSNLFPLSIISGSTVPSTDEIINQRNKDIMLALREALKAKGWYIDLFKFSRMITHRRRANIPIDETLNETVLFFPAYVFQVRRYFDHYYLCIDYYIGN